MDSLVQEYMYGAISKIDPTTTGYYSIMFLSNIATLQYKNTTDGKVLKAGETSVKASYIIIRESNNNWY